ncbi:alpha/beta fold hydrolase [Streptomyces asoensis]|uniref:alpha/beta fold hydrolase n=1 Tax=Streptomyces TaxID=1883 RepID=UPI00190C8208|nr:alpha/beta hydrolase [Streptomyces sp. MBT97]MBK3638088.1 alpha/beta hydrolase [Streptomyces sp. MBT97]
MRLHTQEWGTGERVAVLVHGIMSDHRTWHELVPVLTGRGYRVLAVDLRGHGASPRGPYEPRHFAEDLVETLPPAPEVALGHSLGALALALAVPELGPARAVYSEPAWQLAGADGSLDPALFTLFKRSSRALAALSRSSRPARSTGADAGRLDARAAAEQEALERWDENTALALSSHRHVDHTPEKAVVPSLVQTSDPSMLVSAGMRAELARRGFEVRTVPDAPHAIHRDRFGAFVESLSGWL